MAFVQCERLLVLKEVKVEANRDFRVCAFFLSFVEFRERKSHPSMSKCTKVDASPTNKGGTTLHQQQPK